MQIDLLENLGDAKHFHGEYADGLKNLGGTECFRGGYADVFKCKYQNLEVAVKVLRVYSNSDLPKINHVSRTVPSHMLAS